MKKLKEWFVKNWVVILVCSVLTAVFICIEAFLMGMTKWIVESDLPDWFKMWLIMS